MQTEFQKQRYELLDASRGIAAIIIMFYHLFWHGKLGEGWVSIVDYFFVLSGFVLAPSLLTNNVAARQKFICSRIVRLFPIMIPMVTLLLLTHNIPEIARGLNYSPTSIQTVLCTFLLLQIFVPSAKSLNHPLCSLSAEWVVNILAKLFRGRRTYIFLVAIGLLLQFLGLYLNRKTQTGWGPDLPLTAFGRALAGFYLGLILRIRSKKNREMDL